MEPYYPALLLSLRTGHGVAGLPGPARQPDLCFFVARRDVRVLTSRGVRSLVASRPPAGESGLWELFGRNCLAADKMA